MRKGQHQRPHYRKLRGGRIPAGRGKSLGLGRTDYSKTYYLYKDTFMSGWEHTQGERGSYVIADKPVSRPDFKLIATANRVSKFKFRSGAKRDFELWTSVHDRADGSGQTSKHTRKLYRNKNGTLS